MIRRWVALIPGLLLCLISLTVIVGWYAHFPLLITLGAGHTGMQFNTALSFLLIGLTLSIPHLFPNFQKANFIVASFLLVLMSGLVMIQYLFTLDFHLDQFFIKDWLAPQSRFPGRMAGNTCIGFFLVGLLFLSFTLRQKKFLQLLVYVAIIVVGLLGWLALFGYIFRLAFLYQWYRYGEMAILSGVSFVLASQGLWLTWREVFHREGITPGNEVTRIILQGGVVFVVMISVAMFSGAAIYFRYIEQRLHRELLHTLNEEKENVKLAVGHAIEMTESIAAHPKALFSQGIKKGFLSIPQLPVGVRVYDKNNQVVYSEGEFFKKTEKEIHLIQSSSYHAKLIWQQGWFLQLTGAMKDNKSQPAHIDILWHMPALDKLYLPHLLGETGDLVVCVKTAPDQAACFPNRWTPIPFVMNTLSFKDQAIPMRYALEGKEGVAMAPDYRGTMVVGAYGHVFNLGLVVKYNQEEIYLPIRQNLSFIFSVLVCSLVLGLVLFYWQVAPLLRRIASAKLQAQMSSRLFSSAFGKAPIGMVLVSPKGRFLKVNPAFLKLVGYSETELKKLTVVDITHPDDKETTRQYVADVASGKIKSYQREKRYLHKNGQIVWVTINTSFVRDEKGLGLYFIAQVQDVTEEKKLKEQLNYLAYHDVVTGLLNRAQLEARFEELKNNAIRDRQMIGVIYLDLDKFKKINDTYGHAMGDCVLKEVAKMLASLSRATDILSRVGGDEFIFVVGMVRAKQDIESVLQRIQAAFAQFSGCKGHAFQQHVSMGVAVFPQDGTDLQALIKKADEALYQVKHAGRNQYRFYSS